MLRRQHLRWLCLQAFCPRIPFGARLLFLCVFNTFSDPNIRSKFMTPISIMQCSQLLLGLICSLCIFCSVNAKAPLKVKVRGMAFTSGHDLWAYRQPFATESLRNLKKTGTRYVHITVILGVWSINSLDTYTITDLKSMRFIIRKVHRMGFKIFLKPIVQTPNFHWRGYMPGGSRWFAKVYNPWIVTVAKLAQQEKVEMFSVGSELSSTLAQKRNWENTIKKVRAVYKGWLTYVANHDAYEKVTFWKSLDFISISAYFRLLTTYNPKNPPSKQRTYALWWKQANDLLKWRNRNGLREKKVLIAEAGAQSKGGGVVYTSPWAYRASGPTDLKIQAVVYEAIFRAFMLPNWSIGIILYEWDANPNAGKYGRTLKTYTPQNKPAEEVMTRWFKQKSYFVSRK